MNVLLDLPQYGGNANHAGTILPVGSERPQTISPSIVLIGNLCRDPAVAMFGVMYLNKTDQFK